MSRKRRIIAFLGLVILFISLVLLLLGSLPTERQLSVTPVSPDDLQLPTPEAFKDDSRWTLVFEVRLPKYEQ